MHMDEQVRTLLTRMATLEAELDRAMESVMAKTRHRLAYHVDARGGVTFQPAALPTHRRFRLSLPRFITRGRLRNAISAPVVYALLMPFVLLDVAVCLYQAICFRLYQIAPVRRRDYLAIDRHRLQYLNAIEKLNCFYCSYANGLIAFVSEVAARTEQYWCPIKHATRVIQPHSRYHRFVEYGDPEAYVRTLPQLRAELTDLPNQQPTHPRSVPGAGPTPGPPTR